MAGPLFTHLEKYGWRYVNANVWNKGKGHIAGNVNTKKIRRFPVTTEVCVQYVFEARVGGVPIREWLRSEWERTGLPLRKANEACGVKDAAVRKYLDKGHLWYFHRREVSNASGYTNTHGCKRESRTTLWTGRPGSSEDWEKMRTTFNCLGLRTSGEKGT